MKEFKIIDYSNCITNLTSSIEKYFGLKPSYATLKMADEVLAQKDYKNVLIILFDAMGSAIIDKNPINNKFLKEHKIGDFLSCYPPTTACCTTCYRTGKNASEIGWLGWSSYFKEENITVENFTNKYSQTKEPVGGELRSGKYLPYDVMGEKIENANNDVRYFDFSLFSRKPDKLKHLNQTMKEIAEICEQPGKKFFYVYFQEPDSTMHQKGTKNSKVKDHLRKISRALEYLEKNTKDTVCFVSADHGMIDVKEIEFWKETELMDMLYAFPSCDARTPFFFVKEDKREDFKKQFNKRYGQYYKLYTKEQILKEKIFGNGYQNPKLNDLVGDYVGITDKEYYLSFSEKHPHFKGHHAGIHPDEMTIPLIVLKN